ncbi:MAG: hypothetical protein HYU63_04700 [Armatimonadetes bacterium]|nr:hypothetical protein [Armatimonadota bacterium]
MLNKADSNLNFPKPKTEIFNDDEIAKFPRGETLTLTKGEAQKKNDQEKIILKIQRVKTEIEK